tara:strand:- start:3370 stop:4350 length:981 start_codon:yes stop_codon:yes gene_type:complete
MELNVDTQTEPTGTIAEAQEAILGLMDSQETPEVEEAEPSEAEIPFEASEETEEEGEELEAEEESEGEITEDEEAEFLFEVDGQELSADELRKGYLRQSDYTKKTQSLSEQRKEMESLTEQYNSQLQQIQAERQQYIQHLQALSENQDIKKFDIDWERLRLEDPLEYVTKRQEFQEAKEKAEEVKTKAKQAMARSAAEKEQQWAKVVEDEKSKLIAALPEWGETDSQRQLATELRSYAQTQGYSEPEIDSLVDHRSFLVLRKAMLYDQMQNANPKAKKLKGKPKVIRAGKGASRTQAQRDALKTKRNQLKNSGHVRDAAKVFEDFI